LPAHKERFIPLKDVNRDIWVTYNNALERAQEKAEQAAQAQAAQTAKGAVQPAQPAQAELAEC